MINSLRRMYLVMILLVSSAISALSQTYIGPSLNIGNMLKYTPLTSGVGSTPLPSGSIVLTVRKNFGNDWATLFGANIGIIGYSMWVAPEDTLTSEYPADKSRFPEYSIFYGGLNAVIGRSFNIGIRKVLFGIGGGGVYSYSGVSVSNGLGVRDSDGTLYETFHADIDPVNGFNGFAKVIMQISVSPRVALGFEFSRHFSSVLKGSFQFYHTMQYTSGQISLYQTEASMVCLFRISK
ncbi:MAG: hypothetical protein QM762_25210 [Chryseolinea sp.]